MNKVWNIFLKALIFFKSIFIIFIALSTIMVCSELFNTRNQIEGRELIESTPSELAFLLITLISIIVTLLFDIKTLKRKEAIIYKNWGILSFVTITIIVTSILFKIQWLGISLMMLLGIYAIYLLFKFQKA